MEIIPQVYAELLPNIRQITIYISFPAATSSAIEETRSKGCSISLSNSGDGMLLRYGDRFLRSRLPARAGISAFHIFRTCQLPAWPTQEAKEISIRIPADLSSDEAAFANASVEVPWSAKDIQTGTRIGCSNCHHELLRAHTYDTEQSREWIWKDLPSANWAELMELWHCHKPDSPHNDDEHDANAHIKGYGASNQVLCTPGTILIDVTSFYIAKENCSFPTETEGSLAEKIEPLRCPICNAIIGETAPSLRGYRIFKAKASLYRALPGLSDNLAWRTLSVDSLVAAQLLELAERISVRRFAVYPMSIGGKGPAEGINGMLLWLFNPELRYTTSTHAVRPVRAVKLLYHDLSAAELQRIVNPPTSVPSLISIEELALHTSIYDDLSDHLSASQNKALPSSARKVVLGGPKKVQEWNVGLLRRA